MQKVIKEKRKEARKKAMREFYPLADKAMEEAGLESGRRQKGGTS